MNEQNEGAADGAPIAHPEGIRLEGEMRIGQTAVMRGRVRITQLGLVCTGIMVAAILLSTAVVVRAARLSRPT